MGRRRAWLEQVLFFHKDLEIFQGLFFLGGKMAQMPARIAFANGPSGGYPVYRHGGRGCLCGVLIGLDRRMVSSKSDEAAISLISTS